MPYLNPGQWGQAEGRADQASQMDGWCPGLGPPCSCPHKASVGLFFSLSKSHGPFSQTDAFERKGAARVQASLSPRPGVCHH